MGMEDLKYVVAIYRMVDKIIKRLNRIKDSLEMGNFMDMEHLVIREVLNMLVNLKTERDRGKVVCI
jgi:hypothetical protein